MDIHAKKVKSFRLAKSWTQQHLADASGVSLRTIQRVERHGAASKETVLSLCSTLEISIEEIVVSTAPALESGHALPYKLMALVFILGGMSGAFLMFLLT